jgi:membrane-bound metal-dependent hydrolase YbcI (DUF457 family)
MTSVGHTLTGIAIGVLCMPSRHSSRGKTAHLLMCGLLANVPDFALPVWGHQRYDISHSLFVNAFIILLLSLFLARWDKLRCQIGGWSVIFGASLAWLSHLLLDSFYNHGRGVGIFWPISDAHLTLPIRWFSVIYTPPPPLTLETLRIFAIELVFYGIVLLLAIGLRRSGILDRLVQRRVIIDVHTNLR